MEATQKNKPEHTPEPIAEVTFSGATYGGVIGSDAVRDAQWARESAMDYAIKFFQFQTVAQQMNYNTFMAVTNAFTDYILKGPTTPKEDLVKELSEKTA